MTMPIASLHMGQRRMSRFAADEMGPNLRIIPRTRFGLPSGSSSIVFDNKLNAPKKDAELCAGICATGTRSTRAALKNANEQVGTKEPVFADYRLFSEGSFLQSESLQLV